MAYAAASTEKADDEGLLDVGDLVRMFEESEDASSESRKKSERDRDYYDNKQHTAEELAELAKRGQPAVFDNIIKTKIDYLDGIEKQQRIDPKALPRTPKHEADADSATDALRSVAQDEDYDTKRSAVWRDMLVEGAGGIRIYAEPSKYAGKPDFQNTTSLTQQEYTICIQRVPWDRMFWDPHSAEPNFSDAGYLGIVTWMDYSDALSMYPDGKDVLDTTLSSAPSDTYDDKPKFSVWADKKRKRVRIVQIWIKRGDQWHFAEYTKGGILKAGPSPYKTDKGESDCELFFVSGYVDRDNNRYGFVRELIPLQDEVNKRRSKALHYLNTAQTVREEGAVPDPVEFRRQAVRPDGDMVVNPGALTNKQIEFRTRDDLAEGHFKLLQEAKNSIDVKGPNATEMGDKTGGSNAASGRAIIASQQGGQTQLKHLSDRLRNLDIRVFRATWARVRQYWTAEKWVRVTDDERNVRWVGMNIDPEQMQQMQMQMQQNPEIAKKIGGMTGSVAELDCDIIIDEAPDSLVPQLEQFQTFVELKKYDANGEIPFRSIVRAMPNLRDRETVLKDMDERAQQKAQASQPMQQLQMRGAQAEVAETESKAMLNTAKAHEAGMPEQGQPQQIEQQEPFAAEKAIAEVKQLLAAAEDKIAAAELKRTQAHKTNVEASLAPQQAAQEADLARANFQQGIKDREADRKVAARKTVAA